MRKLIISSMSIVLSLLMFLSFSTEEASAHHIKVTWDGMELKKGQIGSIYIKKSTKIYNYIDGELVFYKTAKAKTKYRAYSINEGTQTYSIGSKQYIKIGDKNIAYKDAPQSKFDQVNTVHQYAFRGTYWGDSMNQVKKVTKSKLEGDSKNLLVYETKMLGYNARAFYSFEKNKLQDVTVTLNVDEEYYLEDLYNGLYWRLRDDLNLTSFNNERYLDNNNSHFGSRDYNNQSAIWKFNSRLVQLLVHDENAELHAIVYYNQLSEEENLF